MKRIAALMLLAVLGGGLSTPTRAQNSAAEQRQADKAARKQAKALYEWQRKQQKAQEKAQRAAEKQQKKAAKKYEQEQRELLKNANRPAKEEKQKS